jgi:hypothetical protein
MFQVLSADQLPESIRKRATPCQSGLQVPFDAIPPGGGIRIPFDVMPDATREFRRFYGSLRVKAHRASTRLGVRFSVHRAEDSFFITRSAA